MGQNAMLLPFSDNSSGKVYCGVVALRDVQPGEELCIDYGVAYWQVRLKQQQQQQQGLQTCCKTDQCDTAVP
jgi:SET domain-containing protein